MVKRISDRTLEIACRISSDGTATENTIHDLSLDLRDARAHIAAARALLEPYADDPKVRAWLEETK